MMIHSEKFLALVADAKQRIKEIDIDTLKAKLPAADFVLIDLREESEWAVNHLPQAQHLSRGIIEIYIERTVPDPNTPIILYCGGGNRSALTADSLQKMGYTNVLSLAGGYRAWQLAGYPVIQ
jgi:rhodanese-related sulfurtransferase